MFTLLLLVILVTIISIAVFYGIFVGTLALATWIKYKLCDHEFHTHSRPLYPVVYRICAKCGIRYGFRP